MHTSGSLHLESVLTIVSTVVGEASFTLVCLQCLSPWLGGMVDPTTISTDLANLQSELATTFDPARVGATTGLAAYSTVGTQCARSRVSLKADTLPTTVCVYTMLHMALAA